MRHHRIASLCRMIALAIAVFSLSTTGLAQTNLNVITHYVDAAPAKDGVSHTVEVYLSVVDETGSPLTNLQPEFFKILEDGQKVEIKNVRLITTEPNNIVLVMDTSNSMLGTGINDAKLAASTFVSGLKPNDQVAVLTFDDQVIPRIDFTTDHNKVNERIKAINATPQGGTCLYNAALAAVRMFSTIPHGNRAIILFTDGRDETRTGAICSLGTTTDQVVAAASDGDLRTPIYTVGLGVEKQIDTKTLQFFADETGGYYLYSASSSKLSNAFQTLSAQLNGQYILTYQSVSDPGSHNLTVNVGPPERTVPVDSDTRRFTLSQLPPHLSFTRPLDGEAIGDRLEIAVSLSSQGQTLIERVAFEVNGVGVGADDRTPYEIALDAKQYPVGTISIAAIAYGENNTEVARSSINVVRVETAATSATIPTLENTAIAPITAPPETSSNPVVLISILLSAVSVVTIGLLIFSLMRQQKQARVQDVDNYEYELERQTMPPIQRTPVYRRIDENRKVSTESVENEPAALAALTIEASDDSSLVGHRFEITASLVTLGRSADNDVTFPNDKPVSRHHAEIYQISGKLYLREVLTTDATGMAQPPKYGTFLNKSPMGSDPALLKTGDEIQLGKRVRLKFESFVRDENAEAPTYDDDLAASDDVDATAMQD